MAILQFRVVCLVMILWASFLAFLPIMANCSIHVWMSAGLCGRGGISGVHAHQHYNKLTLTKCLAWQVSAA